MLVKLIKLHSDNYEGELLTQSEYEAARLEMSSGDFGVHRVEVVEIQTLNKRQLKYMRQDFTQPKGLNRKLWAHHVEQALIERYDADQRFSDGKWWSEASTMSREWAAKVHQDNVYETALINYRYHEMRAHGVTVCGALDNPAKDKWERIAGRPIKASAQWRYDHTVHVTSARRKGSKWLHPWTNKVLKRGAK